MIGDFFIGWILLENCMESLTKTARKITHTLFIAQSLTSAGMIAGHTVHAIVGAKLSANPSWAGVPATGFLLGAAISAYLWGYVMDIIGRRGVMVMGLLFGVIGTGSAFWAVLTGTWVVFLIGLVLMGTANAAVVLGRFAAAEVNPPGSRGKAISTVVLGGTVGALLGPLLVGPAGRWAASLNLDELSGPYVATFVLLLLAMVVVFIRLRPDPGELGRQIAENYPDDAQSERKTRSLPEILRQPNAAVAVLAMVLGQVVMVLVMVITSLFMRDNQHPLGSISVVISAHTTGMYAFSIISGRLADRWGRLPVIAFGAGTLAISCLIASVSVGLMPLVIALFLLGLGWNFTFVAGSALLADQLSPEERGQTQGFNDLMVGLASAFGSFSSGIIFARLGYASMAVISALLAGFLLLVTLYWMRRNSRLGALRRLS